MRDLLARIEIADNDTGSIVYLDRPDTGALAAVDPAARRMLDDACTLLPHLTRDDVALVLVGLLAERVADAPAYERECARRGVLAL